MLTARVRTQRVSEHGVFDLCHCAGCGAWDWARHADANCNSNDESSCAIDHAATWGRHRFTKQHSSSSTRHTTDAGPTQCVAKWQPTRQWWQRCCCSMSNYSTATKWRRFWCTAAQAQHAGARAGTDVEWARPTVAGTSAAKWQWLDQAASCHSREWQQLLPPQHAQDVWQHGISAPAAAASVLEY